MELSKILEKSEVIWIHYLRDKIYFISLIYDFKNYVMSDLTEEEMKIIGGYLLRSKLEQKNNSYYRWESESNADAALDLEKRYFYSLRELLYS